MVRIRIHPLFFLLGIVLFFLGNWYVFLAYLITMVAHEMGHSAAAARFGFHLDDINLMPYGAVINGETDGLSPKQEIIVASCGPAVNLVLAVIFTALWWLVPAAYFFTEVFVISNIVTALFNIIPVFPLDGGRIALAVMCRKMKRGKAMRAIKISGIITALLFTALFIVSIFFKFNVTYSVIAVFIFAGTLTGGKAFSYVRVKAASSRSSAIKRGIPVKEIIIHKSATLFALNKLLTGTDYYKITVTDDALKPVKHMTETEFETLLIRYDIYDTIEKTLL